MFLVRLFWTAKESERSLTTTARPRLVTLLSARFTAAAATLVLSSRTISSNYLTRVRQRSISRAGRCSIYPLRVPARGKLRHSRARLLQVVITLFRKLSVQAEQRHCRRRMTSARSRWRQPPERLRYRVQLRHSTALVQRALSILSATVPPMLSKALVQLPQRPTQPQRCANVVVVSTRTTTTSIFLLALPTREIPRRLRIVALRFRSTFTTFKATALRRPSPVNS